MTQNSDENDQLGDLGEDEPRIEPLCIACVRELPDGGDGLCSFCRVVAEGMNS